VNEGVITLAEVMDWCDHADTRLSAQCALDYLKASGLNPEKYELIPLPNMLGWRVVRRPVVPT